MEPQPPLTDPQPDPLVIANQGVEAASNFLSSCERLSTEYESGYYWEDIQRALRIAAGIEAWPAQIKACRADWPGE
jgi:hypothetical protein